MTSQLHLTILPNNQRRVWHQLIGSAHRLNTHRLYLAGGTALSLQLGHRLSYDFDFFTRDTDIGKSLVEWVTEHFDPVMIREQRDYIDIAAIVREHPLNILLDRVGEKYGPSFNRFVIIKSLTGFDDIDQEMPEMIDRSLIDSWQSILQKQCAKYLKCRVYFEEPSSEGIRAAAAACQSVAIAK